MKADEESSDATDNLPYSVCAISHSLRGATMLMYLVTRCLKGLPHRLSRLTLLSPAGFHEDAAMIFKLFEYFLPTFAPILAPLIPGVYIPTKFFRMLFRKLAHDFQNYPAIGPTTIYLLSLSQGMPSDPFVTFPFNDNLLP